MKRLKARAVRLVNDHEGECSSLTAGAAVVAKQLGVGKESGRRWVMHPWGERRAADGRHDGGAGRDQGVEGGEPSAA